MARRHRRAAVACALAGATPAHAHAAPWFQTGHTRLRDRDRADIDGVAHRGVPLLARPPEHS